MVLRALDSCLHWDLGAGKRVGTHRTAWHFLFTILLRKRGPRWLEVRDEVLLSDEPLRLDYLLLRRIPAIAPDDSGQTLRGLWPRLPPLTIAELKTIGRPYRSRNLDRLLGYLHIFFSADDGGAEAVAGSPAQRSTTGGPPRRPRVVERASAMAGLLIVPARTPTLEQEIHDRGLVWSDLGGGYAELTGGLFRLFVAEIDVVAEEEDDDVLRLFGHEPAHTLEARRFWAEQVGTKEAMMTAQELEEYEEVARRFLDVLPPEKRLVGLAPDQVARALGSLAPDQFLAVMPEELLRALSEEFIEQLPEPTRSSVRARRGR